MSKQVFILFLPIVAVLGCGGGTGSKPETKNVTADSGDKTGSKPETKGVTADEGMAKVKTTDPVESLKVILSKVERDMATEQIVFFGADRGWIKRKVVLSHIEYDVKKSDSLISPFLAPIKFGFSVIQSKDFPTKTEAEKTSLEVIEPSPDSDTSHCRASLAFRDGSWVAKSLEFYDPFGSSWVQYSGTAHEGPVQAIWKSMGKATKH